MNIFDTQLYEEIMESKEFSLEEKEIIRSRFEKAKLEEAIYDKIDDNHPEGYLAILLELQELIGDRCEHDRSFSGTCEACFNLEKKIFHVHPEHYKDDPDYAEYFEED